MRNVTVCDRCKQAYDSNENQWMGKHGAKTVTRIGMITEDNEVIQSFDLCDECLEDLITHFGDFANHNML